MRGWERKARFLEKQPPIGCCLCAGLRVVDTLNLQTTGLY
jgi:hypothetical protein